MSTDVPSGAVTVTRGQVLAWGLWDWGSAAYNAVILTFVFSVYLTGSVGADLPGSISVNSWLGWSTGAAGLLIAVLAPVIARRADAAGRRRRAVAIWTACTVATMAALFLVEDDYTFLALGLILLGLGSIFFELASVSYNAMLVQVSTPRTMGRVSGFGWAMGYLGGIVLLLAVYIGFIVGDGGLLGVPTENGLNIRLVALVAAAWFLVFAVPLLLRVPEVPPTKDRVVTLGVFASYRALFTGLRELYRSSPHTLYFLGASALFRDGLSAVFAFGAVLAVTVYGIAADDVLVFGVAANVVAAAGSLAAGWLDDRAGPKAVIVGSLSGMIAVGIVLLFVSGPAMFWVFGLLLCLFVGPAQSASRTFLARLAPPGREGELFGLYATTGRAVSFLAPTLFGLSTLLFASDRAGLLGILVVLGAGLLALLPVRRPATNRRPDRTAGNEQQAAR